MYCSTDLLNPQEELSGITPCVSDIRTWMIRNKLKINDEKIEFLILHSSHKEFTTALDFSIQQTKIKPSHTCRNLGVMFDSHMKMESQIQGICKSVNFHLRSINPVRNSLTSEATVLVVHALITSRLDYCNSLLQGLPDKLINRLQHLQNIAARVVTCCSKFEHITPVLFELHWLLVRMRIRFKLLLLMYRCVQQSVPAYLCELIHPKKKSKYGIRSYSLDHLEIRQAKPVDIYKTKLKALLFNEYYGE